MINTNALVYDFGPLVMGAFDDPEILEIMLNPDGTLWTERFGAPMQHIGSVAEAQALNVCQLLATDNHVSVSEKRPSLQAVLPQERFGGARVQAFLPPVSLAPTFCIRKRPSRIFPLAEYVETQVLRAAWLPVLQQAIRDRLNIAVVGGTGSGKTTFVNAMIHELSLLCPEQRLVILEDTPEIKSSSANTAFLTSTDFFTMTDMLKGTLRYRPDRILLGEVRDGAALQMLKAWNTGHPGGLGTYHADSAEEALERMEEMVAEATLSPKQPLIGRAINMIVFIAKTPAGRRVTEIIRVHGWDKKEQEYRFTQAA